MPAEAYKSVDGHAKVGDLGLDVPRELGDLCVLVDDVPMLRQRAGEYKVADDSFYARWAAPADAFSQRYLNELLRMAA